MALFVSVLLPAFVRATSASPAAAERRLAALSAIVEKLTRQLPQQETVRGCFLLDAKHPEKKGGKTGPQYRSVGLMSCVQGACRFRLGCGVGV